MYEFYLGETLCPVAPSKLKTKINSQNETINLINDGEVNILKQPGLTDISFDLLLPNVKYPFAKYEEDVFQNAKYYLDILEDLKINRQSFQFKVIRVLPNGTLLFDTDMKVSLEDYTISEDAKDGFDVTVSINLKQFKDYGTKLIKIIEDTASVEENRSTDSSLDATTHTVVKGDCLWNIARKYYGDGTKYTVIFNANKDKISNPHWIYPGQVLTIPAL